jgi:hypothetical protein
MSGYVRQIVVTSVIAAVLVLGIGLGLYYTTATPTSRNSVQGAGDQTVDATYVTTLNTVSSSTSITSNSAKSTSPGGTFTYSPSSPLKILSVQALTSQTGSGSQSVIFNVEFQNAGSSTIYVISGGGSSLNATILSGPVRTQPSLSPKCEIVSAEIPVGVGQNFTSSTPGCWSGYTYQLLQSGTIEVELTLSWSSGFSTGGASGVTDIIAEFSLN